MTYEQYYTPPVGVLTHGHTPCHEWVIQFMGGNWAEVGEFLRFFNVNWCMHLRGGTDDNPDQLVVEDEDGVLHTVLPSNWVTVDDAEERFLGVFSDRYFQAHYLFKS